MRAQQPRQREIATREATSCATPAPRRPGATLLERMRKLAADHQDPKVRAYAARWLKARGETAA